MSTYEHLPSTEESEVSLLEFKGGHQRRAKGLWIKATISFLLGLLVGVITSSVTSSFVSVKTQVRNYSPGEGLPFIGRICLQAQPLVPLLTFVSLPVTPGDTSVLFAHNETFALEPSYESDAAWKDVIPGESEMTFYDPRLRSLLTAR